MGIKSYLIVVLIYIFLTSSMWLVLSWHLLLSVYVYLLSIYVYLHTQKYLMWLVLSWHLLFSVYVYFTFCVCIFNGKAVKCINLSLWHAVYDLFNKSISTASSFRCSMVFYTWLWRNILLCIYLFPLFFTFTHFPELSLWVCGNSNPVLFFFPVDYQLP